MVGITGQSTNRGAQRCLAARSSNVYTATRNLNGRTASHGIAVVLVVAARQRQRQLWGGPEVATERLEFEGEWRDYDKEDAHLPLL